MVKLDIKAFGLSLGIIWSLGVFLIGILSLLLNWGIPFVDLLSSFYKGYSATLTGSFIGAIWGFADAFVGGILFAWLYNKLSR